MGLTSALQIGRSALLANQSAIEVAGNNLANLATRGYHRQSVQLAPLASQEIQRGIFLGRGVQVQAILRQVDAGLEARIRGSLADEAGSTQREALLEQIESLHNELSDQDLSTYLAAFFNSFSELANRPLDNSLRGLVVQQGVALASFLRGLRSGLVDLRQGVETSVDQAAAAANDVLTQIVTLNAQIATAEAGAGGAGTLRDQRDQLLADLAQYLDLSVVEQPSGSVDVYVNSLPIVLGGESRGLAVRRTTVDGVERLDLTVAADGSVLGPTSGKLGSLIAARQGDVQQAIDALDGFTHQLIGQVNRLHSQGQGLQGFTTVTGNNRVADADAVLNTAAAGLTFAAGHGSFQVHVRQKSTGEVVTHTVSVNLDGIDPLQQATLNRLAQQIDGLVNVDASATGDGRLRIDAASGDFEITFSDDTSGALAALGVNTFFTGTDALDVGVWERLNTTPALLAAGQGNVAGDNRTALAIAGLDRQGLADLGGLSLREVWNRHVEDYAIRLGQARQQVNADAIVRENLQAQQQQVSGVNSDEEAINLLAYQRSYQASARFLSVVDEMFGTLLELI